MSPQRRRSPSRDMVLSLLKEQGPMTQRRIADELGWDQGRTHSIIANARRCYPGQLIRVVGYVHDPNGPQSKDQSIYAAEAGEDVPRPPYVGMRKKARRKATQARYREKNRARINAQHRARRAKLSGLEAQANPWSQIVHKTHRAAVTQIEQHQRAKREITNT